MVLERTSQPAGELLIQSQTETVIESWQIIPQPNLDRQESGTLQDAEAATNRQASSSTASDRQNDLVTIVNRLAPPNRKWLLRGMGVVVGMFTCVSGAQVITARLGPLAVPASLVLAGGLVLTSEGAVVRGYTNRRLREQTLTALSVRIHAQQEKPPINVLGEADAHTSISLIQMVEAEPISQRLPVNGAIALVLYGAEYAINLYIISLLGLPGGLLIEAIVSLMPIGIQLAIAVAESESCALPEACAELHQKYDAYGSNWQTMSAEEAEAEQYRIQQLDLKLKFLPHGDPSGRLKNLDMAIADLAIKHYSQRKRRLEEQGIQALQKRKEKLRQDISALPSQFPESGIGLANQQLNFRRRQWVQEQTQRLEQEYAEDIEGIQFDYGLKIHQCQEEIAQAWEHFHAAEQQWYDEQGGQGLPQAG
jgi:hypothetical protein